MDNIGAADRHALSIWPSVVGQGRRCREPIGARREPSGCHPISDAKSCRHGRLYTSYKRSPIGEGIDKPNGHVSESGHIRGYILPM
jgi:hypothetical protein